MKFKPLNDFLLITRDTGADKSKGGILLPNEEKTFTGKVVSAGPGRHVDGKFVPTTVKAGDTVLFKPGSWIDVKVEGKEYLMIAERDSLGVWTA